MFKPLGTAIYKTPWWAIALGGLFALLVLALFTIPFNVLRLTDAGTNRVEKQAIQREIDHTFGDSALALAERVVKAIAERTSDPARKSELDQALKEIADARREIFSAANDAKRSVTEASRAAARDAKRVAKEATAAAREAVIAARDAAQQRIMELQSARDEAMAVQRRVELQDDAAATGFDKAIAEERQRVREADEVIKALSATKKPVPVTLPSDKLVAQPSASTHRQTEKAAAPKVPPSPKVADTAASTERNNLTDGIKFDVGTSDKRVSGSVRLGDNDRPVIQIDLDESAISEPPPPPPLPPPLRDDIRRKVADDFRRVGIGSAMIVTFIPLFFMLLIAKIYIGRSRRAQEVANLKTEEAESANVNRQIVEAKLMVLQAQVEPHFLYNTLANVQALTEVDPQQANKMTGHLISYLRASLPKMRENISTVGQEIELVRAYLNILKMRMGERLDFGVDVPEEMLALPFPPLMLPSLVENAIKHGLEPQREGGRIDVVAQRIGQGADSIIRIMVKDTGRGFSEGPTQSGGGVGLANIRERLLALFGDRARLTLESNIPKGVVATIETPARGATPFTSADVVAPRAAMPTSWSGKTMHIAAKTHSVWAGLLVKVFVGIVAILGLLFILGMIALATGALPTEIGGTRITGVEGMALGTLGLLLGFCALTIAALIVVAVIYGLGFLFLALAIGIPLILLIAAFPALSPFVLIAFLIYWFYFRKRAVNSSKPPPKP